MSRTRLAALALAATTLAASGCGGTTKSSSQAAPPAQAESHTQTGPLTRTELIAKADAICSRVNAQLASTAIRSTHDYARLLPQVAAYEQTELAELGKLTPPASMASDWQQILASTRTLAGDTAKIAEYAKSNNLKAARALLTTATTAQQQMLATAKRNGFKDCSRLS
jgi:hypothetical protein